MFNNILTYFNKKNLKNKKYNFLFEEYDGDEVVVFDTETTGLNPKKDEIISIGAVIIKNNKILTSKSFEVFVTPKAGISKESIKVHNIRECDLENAIDVKDGVGKFLKFIQNRPLVGYYLEFDVKMINQVIKPWLGIVLPNKQIEVSGIYFDYKNRYIPQGHIDLTFATILKNLNLPSLKVHNALNDAIMTAMIYVKLKNLIK